MPSQTSIVNRALTHLGEPSITHIDDAIERARTMKALWDGARDSLTASHRWSFAMTRASLAALVETPVWGFDYLYQLPSGCLRLDYVNDLWVWSGETHGAWQVEQGKIATSLAAPLLIRYVAQATDPGLYPPIFAEALAAKLAEEAAARQTESNPKRQLAMARLEAALSEAKRVNAIENPPEIRPLGSWLAARHRSIRSLNWLRGTWR